MTCSLSPSPRRLPRAPSASAAIAARARPDASRSRSASSAGRAASFTNAGGSDALKMMSGWS
eukprot:31531-Pelagococcus_subviridis.AAC.2